MNAVMAAPLVVRSALLWFAKFMEGKLHENDWKGGWKDCTLGELNSYRDEEAVEGYHAFLRLRLALDKGAPAEEIKQLATEFIREMADEANYCMMEAAQAAKLAGLELPAWDHRGMIAGSPVLLERGFLDQLENAVALGQLCRLYLDETMKSTPQDRRVAIAAFDAAIRDMKGTPHVQAAE